MPVASYKVKIPVPNSTEYEEFTCISRKQACEFLQISMATFHAMLANTLKYKHESNMHLKGIIIEKIKGDEIEENNNILRIEKQNEFFASLIQRKKDIQLQQNKCEQVENPL